MSDEHELTTTEQETEKALEHFINKWLVIGAKCILTALVGGLITLGTTLNTTVSNLKAASNLQKEQVKKNTEAVSEIEKKIDDLHWYLIRANNVKVPPQKEKEKEK